MELVEEAKVQERENGLPFELDLSYGSAAGSSDFRKREERR